MTVDAEELLFDHPARFSADIMELLAAIMEPEWTVLDPFAGTGRIHELPGSTWGVEIEPEWATIHPRTLVGDATALPFADQVFDAVVTSPTYGNRMADRHNAKDPCKACAGLGRLVRVDDDAHLERYPCASCSGTGLSRRYTYRHTLNRPLHPNNSGGMQWGPAYRALHREAWAEAARVTRPGGWMLLNISDHIRNKQRVRVSDWHTVMLEGQGYELIEEYRVRTPRQRRGQNHERRVPYESVMVMRLS